MTTIGKVSDVTGEHTFEWKIEDFLSLPEEVGKSFDSPLFSFGEEPWFLRMYPNRRSVNNPFGSIGVYLCRKNPGSSVSLAWSLGLKTFDGKKNQLRQFTFVFKKPTGYGNSQLCNRSMLSEKKPEFMPSNILTIFCTINLDSESNEDVEDEKIVQDLADILENGEYSDVTIKVKEKEFRLHKSILAGRNPYFNSMFKAGMKETTTNSVFIDDCDLDIFGIFIYFVYTGKIQTLSSDNVCAVYEIADKYQADQLKAECLSFMKKGISVDNFCDFTVLALKHDEKELLKIATDLFCKKIKDIIQTVKWQTFMTEYPTQANELHIKALEYIMPSK